MAASPAYLDGLKLLARRELSEAQVRQRLARRGHSLESVDEAVTRLRAEGAIDDARVAGAIARTQTSVRRRGRRRVRMQIEQAGIDRHLARCAVDEAFADVDEDAVLEAALARRLRGRDAIADDRELDRVYRYLLRQGFDGDRVLAALRRKKLKSSE
ncbi:MAG TPA: regulatory protein RecX [Vicinamibacterales bacterium]